MTEISTQSRAPGFFERYYICRDTTGVMSRGFNVSIRINDSVSEILLSHALRRLILTCPYLAANAFRESGLGRGSECENESAESADCHDSEVSLAEDAKADGKNFRILPVSKILYSDVVFHKEVEKVDGPILEEFSKIRIPVDRARPTWALTVVTERTGHQYLTFACNHMFFDGRSAVYFFEDLVKEIDAVARDSPTDSVTTLFDISKDGPILLPESSETITTLYNSPMWFTASTIFTHLVVPKFVSNFFASYVFKSSPDLSKYPPFNVVPFGDTNESTIRLLRFGPEKVKTILSHCKSQKSTLTPYMAAVMSNAIEKTFTPMLGAFSQTCKLVICGRRFFPEMERETRYGLFVSSYSPYILPGRTVSERAQTFSKGLQQATDNRYPFYKVGLLRHVHVWDFLKSSTGAKETRPTFEISNLGRVDIGIGNLRVADMVFSQGVTSEHIAISVISTPEGGMNIVIALHEKFQEIWGSSDVVEHCIEEFRKGLLDS